MDNKETIEALIGTHKRLRSEAKKTLSLMQTLAKVGGEEAAKVFEEYHSTIKKPTGRSGTSKSDMDKRVKKILNLLNKIPNEDLEKIEKLIKLHIPQTPPTKK